MELHITHAVPFWVYVASRIKKIRQWIPSKTIKWALHSHQLNKVFPQPKGFWCPIWSPPYDRWRITFLDSFMWALLNRNQTSVVVSMTKASAKHNMHYKREISGRMNYIPPYLTCSKFTKNKTKNLSSHHLSLSHKCKRERSFWPVVLLAKCQVLIYMAGDSSLYFPIEWLTAQPRLWTEYQWTEH